MTGPLLQGEGISIGHFARRRRIFVSYVTRLLRLTFLAPALTRAILDGRQPLDLCAAKLIRHSRLPLDWREQRTLLGFN